LNKLMCEEEKDKIWDWEKKAAREREIKKERETL
jgi:hypothetical protein